MTKFFRRFLLPYFIILLATLAAFLVLYTQSSGIIEDNLINNRLAGLRSIGADMDDDFVAVMHMVSHAVVNPRVRNFMNIREPYYRANVIRMIEVMYTLNGLRLAIDSSFLERVFIAHSYGDVVVFPHTSMRGEFFNNMYLGTEDDTIPPWNELMAYGSHRARFFPAMNIRLGELTYDVITYVAPVSVHHGDRSAIVALINNSTIQNMFRSIGVGENGINYIMSSEGEIISYISNGEEIHGFPVPTGKEGIIRFEENGESYLMSYVRSTVLDWTYVSVIRSSYVLEELDAFRQQVMLIIFVLFVITIPFSVFFSLRQQAPLKKLQDTITEQTPLLQHAFISDLLAGKFTRNGETQANTALLGLDLRGAEYMAVVVSGKNSHMDVTRLAKTRLVIDEFAKTNLDGNIKLYHHTNLGRNELAMLFICNGTKLDKYMKDFVGRLAVSLQEGSVSGVSIGIGTVYENVADAYKSYAEAVEAIQYYMVIDSSRMVCAFGDMPRNNEFYFYPEEEEQRLINMVRNGNTEEVRTTLNYVCRRNFIESQLSRNMMTAFINHLCQGIFKIDRLSRVSNEVAEKTQALYGVFHQLGDLEKLTQCTQLYTAISESIHAYKQNKAHNIVNEIKALCEQNFQDPDISLASFADHYNLSETYLSLQFKESTGENFYNHLQTLRLNKAIELLTTTDLSIREISDSVGYSSYNTFAKAFKRKTGINAGDYRKVGKDGQ